MDRLHTITRLLEVGGRFTFRNFAEHRLEPEYEDGNEYRAARSVPVAPRPEFKDWLYETEALTIDLYGESHRNSPGVARGPALASSCSVTILFGGQETNCLRSSGRRRGTWRVA